MLQNANINLSKFWASGYQVFENVIPLEIISEINDFLSHKVTDTLEPAKHELKCSTDDELVRIVGKIATGSNGGLESISKATKDALSGHFSLETRLSETLWKVPLSTNLQIILKALIRSDNISMHMPPTARFVLPMNLHAGVPPHQDISYNKHMKNFVTIWVPFVDIDDECGGVTVYEGSGFEQEHETIQTSSDFWLKSVPTKNFKPIHCTMKVGSILALNKYVVHSSTPNQSSRTRLSIDYRFFNKKYGSTKHSLDLKHRLISKPQEESM